MKVKAKEKKTVKSNYDTEKDKAKQNSLHSFWGKANRNNLKTLLHDDPRHRVMCKART
jgi:hypothetical protein